ncbi:amidase domain protein [Metarhizium robertsii]|uniref:Amidase signature domain protein n=2 Tax=Metarhizium robertsii TaxID=568076 RepID=E9FD68_METRA|nr:Amidase signature domain protein [Metarhizium robertsii ARSEF 23]EFY94312.1 Amidase signature domain protein [Metarhizium robertsii ARSEF 23]EXU98664.1 amidase domain protein [Metarhizium robertsii]
MPSLYFEPSVDIPLEPSLVTVVCNRKDVPLNKGCIRAYLDGLDKCDVFDRKLFLAGIIITTPRHRQTIPPGCREYLKEFGKQWANIKIEKVGGPALAPGPYPYANKVLQSVCRLYDDEQGAFLSTIKPNLGHSALTKVQQLRVAGVSYGRLAIAVPPRAPTSATNSLPQLRVAVNPAPFTAQVVQALVKDGAHVLAFNPRGDGYQSPAGSSSGSAAAVAAYDWLDCALSTDTSGSGRRPAMANGVWQFRPSHDSISLSGLCNTYAKFDTPCVFARSLDILERVITTWIPPPPIAPSKSQSRSYRLIYSEDYMSEANTDQMKIIDAFIKDAEDMLPATVTQFSIRNSWKQSHPPDTCDDIEEYLDDVIRRPPFVIPFVQRRWVQGATVSTAQHEEGTRRLLVCRTWLHEQLLGDNNIETFMLLPVANAKPVYRDEVLPSPEKQSALDQLFIPPILGAPDIVIPIGEIPYHSKRSHQTEFLPVVANLVGAPKRDFELLRAVEIILGKSGRAKVVATGSRIFS